MKQFSKNLTFVIGAILALVFLSTFVWLLFAPPVLVQWFYGINYGSICDPPFVILNPLRDREVERVADNFLEKLKSGKVNILDEIITNSELLEHIKEGESKAKIKSWFAADRTEENNKANFTYWIERDYEEGCLSMSANIELERVNGNWKVIGFNPTY